MRGGEAAAEGRVEEETGERRLRGDAGAAVAGHRGVGDGPDGEDHRVGRVVGVDARRHVVEQETGGEAIAAEERSRERLRDRLDAALAARHVDVKDAPAVALHGHEKPPDTGSANRSDCSADHHFSYYA